MKRNALFLIASALTLNAVSGQTLLWFDRANGQVVAICGPNDEEILHDDHDQWNFSGRTEFIPLCDANIRRPGNWDVDGTVPNNPSVTVSLGYLPGGQGGNTILGGVNTTFGFQPSLNADVGTLLIGAANTLTIRNHKLTIHTDITNDGTLNLFDAASESSDAILTVAGPMTLDGSGTFQMGDPAGGFSTTGGHEIASANAADILTLDSAQTFRVGGLVNTLSAALVNNTTIDMLPGFGGDSGRLDSLILNGLDKVNNSVIQSREGSSIKIEDITVDNQNGILMANGFMEIVNSTINGGQLLGTGVYEFDDSILTGPVVIGADARIELAVADTLTLQGAVTHDGVLELLTTAPELMIDGPLTLAGSGTLRLDGSVTASISSATPGSVLTIPATQTVEFKQGTVEAGLVTNGLVEASDFGTLTFSNGLKTNNGTWRVLGGVGNRFWNVLAADSILTNYNPADGSLTGGRWEVISLSDLRLTWMDLQGACIKSISPGTAVVLSGSSASFRTALNCLEEVAGSLSLRNGKVLTLNQDLAISGELEFGLNGGLSDTRLVVNGDIDFTGAVIDVSDYTAVNGNYEVVTWTGTATGTPTLRNVPPGFDVSVGVGGNSLELGVTGPDVPELLSIARDSGTGLSTITYRSVDGMSYGVGGGSDLQTYDPLPDTVVGDGSVKQYMHTTAPGTDRFFYRFFRKTEG